MLLRKWQPTPIFFPGKFHGLQSLVGYHPWGPKESDMTEQLCNAFELWCWRRLLRVPWIARRSNQSILKEISPGCSLEEWMLKLKPEYFGHLMQRTGSFEKTLIWERLGASWEGDDRRWDSWMASPTQWTWVWVDFGSWWWTGRPGVLQFMESQRVGHAWVTKLNWTMKGEIIRKETGGGEEDLVRETETWQYFLKPWIKLHLKSLQLLRFQNTWGNTCDWCVCYSPSSGSNVYCNTLKRESAV